MTAFFGQNQTGKHRAKRVLGALVVALLLFGLAAPVHSASRRTRLRQGKQQLAKARSLHANLNGTPKKNRREKDYLNAARRYRRVYDLAPFSGIAADALAARAELYHDMGAQFGRKYWVKAIEEYRFLRREYPYSRYRDSALFNIAQVQHVHLKDWKAALASYQAVRKAYPRSRYAAKARIAIQQISKERAATRKPKRAPPTHRVQVRNIRYWNTKDYTRVVVDLDEKVRFQDARLNNPDRIFFDLFNSELSPVLSGKTFTVEEGLLKRLRVAENRSGVTRVVLEVKNAQDYSVFTLPNPFRLVVDIRAPNASTTAKKGRKPSPAPAGGKTEVAGGVPPQPVSPPKPTRDGNLTNIRALGLKMRRIGIDPGHGGYDTGTVGATGLMEKDLVLDVAQRLGRMLQKQLGAEVVYTREDDTYVPLENRIALANERQVDLFISIHANSSRNRGVRGVETFYLNFTSDPAVLELASRENALSQKSVHELQDLVRQITRNEKISESRELAGEIQRHLHGQLRKSSRRIINRGVKRAPFVVLIGGTMPSVLTEIAFLSNRTDEKILKSAAGRQKVAEGLYAGLSQYMENLNSLAMLPNGQKSAANPK
jgi:N-acetylmuramoyl-L-alanine amidase